MSACFCFQSNVNIFERVDGGIGEQGWMMFLFSAFLEGYCEGGINDDVM